MRYTYLDAPGYSMGQGNCGRLQKLFEAEEEMSELDKCGTRGPYWNMILPHDGISLRDYFAGQAIKALFPDYYSDYQFAASEAYRIADCMIKAREKK